MSQPPPHPRIDVLCVGHAAFDIIMVVDHHPRPDEKCAASWMMSCGGGPAANAAVTVARLGGSSAFVGYLGDDHCGEEHLTELTAAGVRTDFVVRGKSPTPLSLILVKPDGKRSVINHKTRTPVLEENPVEFSCCHPSVILFDGHEPLISLPLARLARERGIATVLDAGSIHKGTIGLAPLADYLIASERFAKEYTGTSNPKLALKEMTAVAPFVVITRGGRGLLWGTPENFGSMAAFRVKALDTTGAGDAFHGAFALGLAQGKDFQTILTYASATAAICCTRFGARPGIPSGLEVSDFLAGTSRRQTGKRRLVQ